MDDVLTLANCRRRRALARHEVATLVTRHRAERIRQIAEDVAAGPLPSLARAGGAAADVITDFATTLEVERMWEVACADHDSAR
jgi:hypothetical protein